MPYFQKIKMKNSVIGFNISRLRRIFKNKDPNI